MNLGLGLGIGSHNAGGSSSASNVLTINGSVLKMNGDALTYTST